jgi:hypothetical protein
LVRIELITPDRERVAIVMVPKTCQPPSIVLWCGRAFHRFGAAGVSGRELCDGDIYRECSVVEGVIVE